MQGDGGHHGSPHLGAVPSGRTQKHGVGRAGGGCGRRLRQAGEPRVGGDWVVKGFETCSSVNFLLQTVRGLEYTKRGCATIF